MAGLSGYEDLSIDEMNTVNAMRHDATSKTLASVLDLVRCSFGYMDERIDPPSSIHQLTLADVKGHCSAGEVWSLDNNDGLPIACMFLKRASDALYLGRLAVAASSRGQGLASQLLEIADERAMAHGVRYLELKTRVELVENHTLFKHIGFEKSAEGRHIGYDRSTYIVMRKAVEPPLASIR